MSSPLASHTCPSIFPSGKEDFNFSTAVSTREALEEAIATPAPASRASPATAKPIPDVPPMTSGLKISLYSFHTENRVTFD
jgi:hypothetical protein